MRKERFLEQRNSKLQPRGDRSFQVLDRISDNAYKINLPGKYVVSTNLNAANLTPFDVGDDFKDLRTNASQEGGNDEDIEAQGPTQGLGGPMTKARARKTEETLQQVVATILEAAPAMNHIEPKLYQ